MFFISLPATVKVGDTADVKINGEPRKVTYRDAKTMVVEPDDARCIVDVQRCGELNSFVCSDADGNAAFTILTPGDQ
jgi:hypothetical protein